MDWLLLDLLKNIDFLLSFLLVEVVEIAEITKGKFLFGFFFLLGFLLEFIEIE